MTDVVSPFDTPLDIEDIPQSRDDTRFTAQTTDGSMPLDRSVGLLEDRRTSGTCFNPWQFLRVDVFLQTSVCCTYFGRLPEFSFLSARDFHSERGMWNHPFMQHMRAHDGTEEEVPYCGFCQGRYRPDLSKNAARNLAITESQALLQDKLDETAGFAFSGRIGSLNEDLSRFQVKLRRKNGANWSPFRSKRQSYRRTVRLAGFQNIGHVAQLGASPAAYAPFLAEPANRLTLVDWQTAQMENVRELMAALELDITIKPVGQTDLRLPFEDGTLAGIWLDAHRWLDQFACVSLFAEIRRVLRPGGVLRVMRAPSSGAQIMKAATADSPAQADLLIDGLLNETKLSGPATFFTVEKVYRTMKRLGFAASKKNPPQIHKAPGASAAQTVLEKKLDQWGERLRDPAFRSELAARADLQAGLEMAISFTATRR